MQNLDTHTRESDRVPSTDRLAVTEASEVGRVDIFPSRQRAISVVQLLLVGGMLVCLTAGGVVYAAEKSMPGDALYRVKTRVNEPSMGLFRMNPDSRVSYDATLMERRLAELSFLRSDEATTSSDVLALVSKRISVHAEDAVAEMSDPGLHVSTKIELLTALAGILAAQDRLVTDTEEFASMRDAVSESRKKTSDVLDETIDAFVASASPEEVQAHLATHISEISEQIPTLAPGSEAQTRVRARITDAQEALIDGDSATALGALLRAKSAIAIDGYLWGSERGEDGFSAGRAVITEGQ